MPLIYEPVSVNMPAVWLVLMIILLVIEGVVPGLVSIWFALGALAALLSAIVGAPIWLQIVWFLLISVVSLILTRPLAKKYVNSKTTPTNADMLIGQECVVTEAIDNVLSLGDGGRVLGILHGLQKIPLFGSRQIGQLHSGIEGDSLLIHQVQQFRDEVGQADEPFDLGLAIITIQSYFFCGCQLRPNLGRS